MKQSSSDFWSAPDWQSAVLDVAPTGSRVICTPPPLDTDEDFVCFAPDQDTATQKLKEMGFLVEGQPDFYTGNNRGNFLSFRRDDTNLIVTDSLEFFDLFRAATELAQRFNLTKKPDRIALFQVVLYGVRAENLEAPLAGE